MFIARLFYSYTSCGRGPGWREGGGVLLGICGRVCRPALQILTLFQTKIKDVISHPFSDLASNIHNPF